MRGMGGGSSRVVVFVARTPPVHLRVVSTAAVYDGRGGHRIRAFESRDTALITIVAGAFIKARGGQTCTIVTVERRADRVVRDIYRLFGTCILSFHLRMGYGAIS